MHLIRKEDVVGARIVDVHGIYELTETGLDVRTVYFTVDRGFSFNLPFAGAPWMTIDVPPSARRLSAPVEPIFNRFAKTMGLRARVAVHYGMDEHPAIDELKRRTIAGVFCGAFDRDLGFHYPPDGIIVFEDGTQTSNNLVAPHGTGSAGLRFVSDPAQITPIGELVDYFSIPMDDLGQNGRLS